MASGISQCRELREPEIIAEAKEEVVDAVKEDICAGSEAWDLSKIQSYNSALPLDLQQ